jgi:hypothetical protein
MTKKRDPPVSDPDNIPETLCLGKFNVAISPPLGQIIFTHLRAKAGPLLDGAQLQHETVVRARIVTSVDNLIALRDALNAMLKDAPTSSTVMSSSSRLN